MDATVTNPVVPVDPDDIPDGTYDGVWGGRVVMFDARGKTYLADASEGIRAIKAPCRVTVKAGRITVTTSPVRE